MRNLVRKIIAVFLLFLFLEKIGLRMFIHTHYHDRSLSVVYNQNPDRGSQTVSILPCDCLDDFFIPLNAVEEIRLCVPTTQLKSELIIQSQTNHNTPFTILHQLRGPPDLL